MGSTTSSPEALTMTTSRPFAWWRRMRVRASS